MINVQAEYCWDFFKRWGMVAFGGVGSIWGRENREEKDYFEKELLLSLESGIRFMLSKEKKINMRLDYA